MKDILVVDDDIMNLGQISAQLSDLYRVSLAKSGIQELAICATERPDLILLDVEMPEINGFETIKMLKRNLALNRIPVIFITGSSDTETEVRCLESGARDFILKPLKKSILLHRIELHLRIADYQSSLENMATEITNSIATSLADLI